MSQRVSSITGPVATGRGSFRFSGRGGWGCGCLGAAAAVLALWVMLSIHKVDAGEVGVIKTGGSVSHIVDAGYNFVPFAIQSMEFVNTRTQSVSFSEIDASTKELQSVKLTGNVVYVIGCGPKETNCNVHERVKDVVNRVGTEDIEGRLLDKSIQDYVKEVTPSYPIQNTTAADGVTENQDGILFHRGDIRQHAIDKLNERLHSNYPGIVVLDIFVANLAFSPQYEKAIEDKQAAAQRVLQAQQEQAKAKVDAQTAVIAANGERDANVARQSGLTANTLEQAAINKWDGHLPQYLGGTFPFGIPVQKP